VLATGVRKKFKNPSKVVLRLQQKVGRNSPGDGPQERHGRGNVSEGSRGVPRARTSEGETDGSYVGKKKPPIEKETIEGSNRLTNPSKAEKNRNSFGLKRRKRP